MIPANELEAQDAAFKTSSENYEAQMNTYRNSKIGEKVYSQFSGGPVDVSAAGLAQYNKTRDVYEPEVTRIERPKGGGTEAEFLSRIDKKGGFVGHVTYKEPKKSEPADWSKVELNKMPTKKATVVSPSAKLKTRTPEKPELASFESPGVQKKGKASTGGTSVSMNPFAKGATSKGAAGRYVKQVVQSVGKTGGKSKDMMGYNRQEKQFKAYAGTSVLGESHIGKTAQDLNEYKKEYKSQRKEYRREGNAEGVAATGMEVKQARQAEKFVKGKQAHFNDENYRKTTGKTSRIAPDYRKSAENAANRNTMQAKLDAVSAKPTNKTSMY